MGPKGPVYDSAVKALYAAEAAVLCQWLGAPVKGGLEPLRLSETVPPFVREIDLLVATDVTTVLHIEFQTRPERGFAYRMLTYWLWLAHQEQLRGRRIVQHVVMLGEGEIEDGLSTPDLQYRYTVHYVRDHDAEALLTEPALAPFAALGRAAMPRREILRRALDVIAAVPDRVRRDVMAHAAADLAAIRLDRVTIEKAWKESAMPVPSLTGTIREEVREEVRDEVLGDVREELLTALLRARFGTDERIPGLAHTLAERDPDETARRIVAAATLDDLR